MKYLTMATATAALLLAGCEPSKPQPPDTSTANARAVESNQQRLQTVIPAPQLDTSLERANLAERLQRINQQNMSGYIYLLSYGRVVAEYAVRGKVTSLNAYLMAGERVTTAEVDQGEFWGTTAVSVEQPDYDGAYGKNAEGIFFFTAESNAYVEWAGDYLFSDQPLTLAERPLMVREIKEN